MNNPNPWRRMTGEQLLALARQVGEQRGNRQTVSAPGVAKTLGDRMVATVQTKLAEFGADSDWFNVRSRLEHGRMLIDIHVAGESSGEQERTKYNNLRAGGRSHQEAIDTMITALRMNPDHVKPAVGSPHFLRVTCSTMPGGNVYSRREPLGRIDNPNAAEVLTVEEAPVVDDPYPEPASA